MYFLLLVSEFKFESTIKLLGCFPAPLARLPGPDYEPSLLHPQTDSFYIPAMSTGMNAIIPLSVSSRSQSKSRLYSVTPDIKEE